LKNGAIGEAMCPTNLANSRLGGHNPLMFQNVIEYLQYGAGRPFGTVWSMEKAYFKLRRKYPVKEEVVYIKGSLLSRYPDRPASQINEIARGCTCIEDAIFEAVRLDFGDSIAARVKFALFDFPACSQCGKYLALSGTSALCYGCRMYSNFRACSACNLFWDDHSKTCPRCGKDLWKITD
jgi:hypothetical protein